MDTAFQRKQRNILNKLLQVATFFGNELRDSTVFELILSLVLFVVSIKFGHTLVPLQGESQQIFFIFKKDKRYSA